jgi:hypothetical protein
MAPKPPFWWIKDQDTLGDLLYDLAREEMMLEELENPGNGLQPW